MDLGAEMQRQGKKIVFVAKARIAEEARLKAEAEAKPGTLLRSRELLKARGSMALVFQLTGP